MERVEASVDDAGRAHALESLKEAPGKVREHFVRLGGAGVFARWLRRSTEISDDLNKRFNVQTVLKW